MKMGDMLLSVAADLSADGSDLTAVGSVHLNSQDPNASFAIFIDRTSADFSGKIRGLIFSDIFHLKNIYHFSAWT